MTRPMKTSLGPILQAMAAAGCTAEQIVAAVQSLEAEAVAAAAARRAKNAGYMRRHRARKGEAPQ